MVSVPTSTTPTEGSSILKSAEERMDLVAAYREVGTYRGAAAKCGTTHRTVKRAVEKRAAEILATGKAAPEPVEPAHNYDAVAGVVAQRVESTRGRISAKRVLPEARA